MSKRIVVTGMGAITPLGCGVEQVWRRLLAGQSGIRSLPEELIGELSTTIGGQVPDSLQAVSYTHLTLPTILLV